MIWIQLRISEAAALVDIDAPEDETPAAEEEPDDFGEEALAEMPQDLPLSDESEDKATREQPVPALGVSDFGDDGSDILASALGEAEDVERDIAALEQADADESPLPDEEPDDFDEEPSTRETTSVKTRRQPVDEKDHSGYRKILPVSARVSP